VLKEQIEADKVSATNFLTGGAVKDFAQYKETAGLLRGLDTCLRYIEDLSRKEYEDD
jgi:hypothetical protein|tara:strand:- start:1803 stop:1973 length:171 start_codon:yes stop_codon:yes gene_type:complete